MGELPDWIQFLPHGVVITAAIMLAPSVTKIIVAYWAKRKESSNGNGAPRDRVTALVTDLVERHRVHVDRDEETARDLLIELRRATDSVASSNRQVLDVLSRIEVAIAGLRGDKRG